VNRCITKAIKEKIKLLGAITGRGKSRTRGGRKKQYSELRPKKKVSFRDDAPQGDHLKGGPYGISSGDYRPRQKEKKTTWDQRAQAGEGGSRENACGTPKKQKCSRRKQMISEAGVDGMAAFWGA